ncbi:MAG: response regulator [Gammaproteobacteria bacterium]
MIRILLVDDHKIVRTGIRKILETAQDLVVVGEADTGEQAIDLVRSHKPDLVMMDKHMPGIGGVEAMRRVLASFDEVKVICLTMDGAGPMTKRILEMGVMGYLTKSCEASEMIEAVHKVMAGERFLGAEIARQMAEASITGEGDGSPFDQLSERELQVCNLIAQGYAGRDISNMLHLSPKTVSTYRTRIFQKAKVDNVPELVRLAMHYGLIDSK